jgi:hypothetical protein
MQVGREVLEARSLVGTFGHVALARGCPFIGVERTSFGIAPRSESDPTETLGALIAILSMPVQPLPKYSF